MLIDGRILADRVERDFVGWLTGVPKKSRILIDGRILAHHVKRDSTGG
jgi:hypothetical protein